VLSLDELDDARVSRRHWIWTLIASLGDFLDAGMFGATGITLIALSSYLHFNNLEAGFPALVTLLGTAFGALAFGKLGDRFGRKYIYQLDMVIYAFSSIMLSVTGVFSSRTFNLVWVIVFYTIIGIAVGADIPASWSLITELSPKAARAKLFSLTNVMWFLAVIVDLIIAIILYNTGMILFRTLWIMLGVVAIASWILRKKLPESPRYNIMKRKFPEVRKTFGTLGIGFTDEKGNERASVYRKHIYRELFSTYGYITVFAWFLYMVWGIPASTYGEFFPYIFSSLHIASLKDIYAFEMISLVSAIVPGLLVFSILADRTNFGRLPVYLLSAGMCSISFYIFVYPPFLRNIPVLITSFLLFGIGEGLGVWPITRLFSVEHFPTSIRNSGQGFIYFTMRFETAIFGLFTPIIVGAKGIHVSYIGWIAGTLFLMGMAVTIILFIVRPEMIRTEGRSIDAISGDQPDNLNLNEDN